jgi:hypothetical protein
MSGHPVADSPEEIARRAELLVRSLSRHFVSLQGTYLIPAGQPNAGEHFFSHSGFVVAIRKAWLLVTAGHILKKLDQALALGQPSFRCHLADYFGPSAKNDISIPFDYASTRRTSVDDDNLGLDFGLILLTPHYIKLLKDNGVEPVPESHWAFRDGMQFELYGILGLPEELFDHTKRVSVTGHRIIGGVRPVLMFATGTDAVPREKPAAPRYPWFAAQLKDKDQIKKAEGMSGGPIFGFEPAPDGRLMYRVLAVQGWWDKERRIVFGSRLCVFMGLLEAHVRACITERQPRPSKRRRKKG